MKELPPHSEHLSPRDRLRRLMRLGARVYDSAPVVQHRPLGEIIAATSDDQCEIGSDLTNELIAAVNDAPLHFGPDAYDKTAVPDEQIARHIELICGDLSGTDDRPAPPEEWSVRLNPAMFVSAAGLNGWQPRKPESMKPYSSDAMPISFVTIDMYPDGSVAAHLVGDGAHRLLAARWANVKRREGATVAARNVTVRRIADSVGQVP